MRFLPFKEHTRSFAPPAGWDQELDGDCGTLQIIDVVDVQSGQNFMYSLWRPEPEELEQLLAGGAIRLGIMGAVHPVVNLAMLPAENCETLGVEDP